MKEWYKGHISYDMNNKDVQTSIGQAKRRANKKIRRHAVQLIRHPNKREHKSNKKITFAVSRITKISEKKTSRPPTPANISKQVITHTVSDKDAAKLLSIVGDSPDSIITQEVLLRLTLSLDSEHLQ